MSVAMPTFRVAMTGLSALTRTHEAVRSAAETFVARIAHELAARMAEEAPRGKTTPLPPKSERTKRLLGLRESIDVLTVRRAGIASFAEVGSPLDYASFVTDGTKPHVIIPRRRKALCWWVGGGASSRAAFGTLRGVGGGVVAVARKGRGKTVVADFFRFAQRVQHPGTKPNDFMSRAWHAIGAATLQAHWAEAMRLATAGDPPAVAPAAGAP